MCRETSSPRVRSLQLDVPSLVGQAKRRLSEGENTIIERMVRVAHRNNRTLAYAVVIGTYALGFTEYAYLRLSVLVSGPYGSVATGVGQGKDALHYAIAVAAFVVIALFQLICFFGLTISERILVMSRLYPRQQITHRLRILISSTIQRTFVCYGVCSLIVCMLIFYMLGIEDSQNLIASTICVYLFDLFVILYFSCFPLITIIYHPHVHCRSGVRSPSLPPTDNPVFDTVIPSDHSDPISPSPHIHDTHIDPDCPVHLPSPRSPSGIRSEQSNRPPLDEPSSGVRPEATLYSSVRSDPLIRTPSGIQTESARSSPRSSQHCPPSFLRRVPSDTPIPPVRRQKPHTIVLRTITTV